MTKRTLVWFRQDLRLADNPALHYAAKNGSIMPIYIFDESQKDFKMGAASRWWLHHSLTKLNEQFDGKLGIYMGKPAQIIMDLISEYKLDAVCWNRCYEPWRIDEDSNIKSHLDKIGVECENFKGSLIYDPWDISKDNGEYYKVFTPFYKKLLNHDKLPGIPYQKPTNLDIVQTKNTGVAIDKLNLLPEIHWYKGLEAIWQPGEEGAMNKLKVFLNEGLQDYGEARNFPSKDGTSRLSPHLHFGEISARQLWHMVQKNEAENKQSSNRNSLKSSESCASISKFLSELGWREFSYHLLYHFPELPRKSFKKKFDGFMWDNNIQGLEDWQKGQTGYPIVDAGMRELWQTGFMHNRVRLITASFLVKNLLVHWHKGAEWFWDCLVDADLANNSMNWQWIAGSGADAAPYFRIFNPVLQGEKFDPAGHYTKHYVPELKEMPLKYLFKPWEASELILKSAGLELGHNYPKPIVDLTISRDNALKAYRSLN